LSDRRAKTDVSAVNHRETLNKLDQLPVTTWRYKQTPNLQHIGPMAQDFHGTFGLGSDNRRITALDADGVALSALKGLIEELEKRKERSAAQGGRLSDLEEEMGRLRKQLQVLSRP
jgi:hypothetical protein